MRSLLRDILDYFRHNKDDDKVGVIILESDQLKTLEETGYLVIENDVVGVDSSWVFHEDEITIIDRSEL